MIERAVENQGWNSLPTEWVDFDASAVNLSRDPDLVFYVESDSVTSINLHAVADIIESRVEPVDDIAVTVVGGPRCPTGGRG